jgi:hypothetical protein
MKKKILKFTCLVLFLSSLSISATNLQADLKNNSTIETISIRDTSGDPEIYNIVPLFANGQLVGYLVVFTNGEVIFFDLR